MSSGTIELGKAVRDFTKSDLMPEYTNVEFQVDNEHSVYAKYFGSLIPDNAESFYKVYGSGQAIIVSNNNDIYFETNRATSYGMGAFSNPAVATYNDLVGRTVHFEADVIIGSGSTGNVVINAYFRKDRDAKTNEAVEIKRIGLYSANTHVSFDFVVGDWITTSYTNSYLCFSILISSNGTGTFSVDNIQYYAVPLENENTLVAFCPFADSAMARRVLESLSGFQYKPYEATGARLDMAAEFGDTVSIDGSSYGLYEQDINFSSESVSTISAPSDQELEHEFSYVPTTERRFRREVATLKAELNIQSGKIEAKVDQQGGSRSSFGWTLEQDNFTVYSGNVAVLKVDKDGAQITGRVNATSGNIGGCEIVNGVLQVSSANIGTINANQITAGYLSVDRIQQRSLDGSKLAENSVGNFQLGNNAVQEYNIMNDAVSYNKGNYDVRSHLTQAGNAWATASDISSKMQSRFDVYTLGVGGNIYIGSHAFRPQAYSVGTSRYILGSPT